MIQIQRWSVTDWCSQAWLILRAHRARALGPRPLGGPQKWEKRGKKEETERETHTEREREREGERKR